MPSDISSVDPANTFILNPVKICRLMMLSSRVTSVAAETIKTKKIALWLIVNRNGKADKSGLLISRKSL